MEVKLYNDDCIQIMHGIQEQIELDETYFKIAEKRISV